MAPIIDIGGQAFIRFQAGLSAGSWNGSTDNVNNNIQTIPAAGERHHYAIVYDGASKMDYYLDGKAIFQSTNGSPGQITKWISWGNIRHSSVQRRAAAHREYDAVSLRDVHRHVRSGQRISFCPRVWARRKRPMSRLPAVDATDAPGRHDVATGRRAFTPATHDV
jgi:hypothetical protein